MLLAHGGQPARSLDEAEVIVVNTCGFIDAAKRESIDALVEAGRYRASGNLQLLAAVGCMVQRYSDELRAALPEVDLFLGTADTDRLLPELAARGLVAADALVEHPVSACTRVSCRTCATSRSAKAVTTAARSAPSRDARAPPILRVRRRCARGTTPGVQGAREINLVAQDLAHYGTRYPGWERTRRTARHVAAPDGVPWYRLLYIYSAGLTPRLLDTIAREPRIVPVPRHPHAACIGCGTRAYAAAGAQGPPTREDPADSRDGARHRDSHDRHRRFSLVKPRLTCVSCATSWKTSAWSAWGLHLLAAGRNRAYELADDVPDEVKRASVKSACSSCSDSFRPSDTSSS